MKKLKLFENFIDPLQVRHKKDWTKEETDRLKIGWDLTPEEKEFLDDLNDLIDKNKNILTGEQMDRLLKDYNPFDATKYNL